MHIIYVLYTYTYILYMHKRTSYMLESIHTYIYMMYKYAHDVYIVYIYIYRRSIHIFHNMYIIYIYICVYIYKLTQKKKGDRRP